MFSYVTLNKYLLINPSAMTNTCYLKSSWGKEEFAKRKTIPNLNFTSTNGYSKYLYQGDEKEEKTEEEIIIIIIIRRKMSLTTTTRQRRMRRRR